MELEFARLQKLNELQAAIGYKFKDTSKNNYLARALFNWSVRAFKS